MENNKKSTLFEIVIPLAKYKAKGKEQLCSLNNYSKWGRFAKTKIKTEYKELLKEFYIPTNNNKPYRNLEIEFQILRHNKRKVDADNLAFNHKWFIDSLVETSWLTDDDQVTIILVPSKYVANINETQFKIFVRQN